MPRRPVFSNAPPVHSLLWRILVCAGCAFLPAAAWAQAVGAAPSVPLERITLPPGFSISLYANASFPARFMALGQADEQATVVYVSSTRAGVVTALVDRGGGDVQACTLLAGLDTPNGIAYDRATGYLYVAEVTQIRRYGGVDQAALAGCDESMLQGPAGITADLPDQSGHTNRALGIGPDGKLYVTVAFPENVGPCEDPFCSIHRLNKDGSGLEIYARGIRNAAGWDWHPNTGALLFAGMERDMMGDDIPDDTLGAIYEPGTDWRFPYCHWEGDGTPELRDPGPGQAIPDADFTLPEFANQSRPADAVLAQRCSASAPAPLQALGPHVAPLGVLYWGPPGTGDADGSAEATDAPAAPAGLAPQQQQWPEEYSDTVFVGEHGSWNRRSAIGYRLANVRLSPDGRTAVGHTVFADGWLGSDGKAWGRPVGLLRLPDGTMLVADDALQVVYAIRYGASPPPAAPPPPRVPTGAAWQRGGHGSGWAAAGAALASLALA